MEDIDLDHVIKRRVLAPQNKPSKAEKSHLDSEIQKILSDSNLNMYEKWFLYNEALSKYLDVVKRGHAPQIEMIYEPKSILEYIPDDKKVRADKFLKYFPEISRSKKGELTLPTGPIQNSNFLELLDDLFSNPKSERHFVPVEGDNILKDYLQSLNRTVPASVILNRKYKKHWTRY